MIDSLLNSQIRPLVQFARGWRSSKPMRITLVRPPSIVSRYSVAAPLTPPLGLAYIASSVRESGHLVQLIDGVGENLERPSPRGKSMLHRGLSFEEIIHRIDPRTDIVGVSCMFSSEWPYCRDLIQAIRGARPDVPIIGGGEHFTAIPEESMKNCPEIFACVIGEGEEILLDLLEHLSQGAPLDQVEGIVFRDEEGNIKRTPSRGRIRNIDDIPWPAWDLVPMENYLSQGLGLGTRHGRSMPMLATRGCPYQCTFCSSPNMWTTRWIARDPEKVIDEIQYYMRLYKINDAQFFDLTAIIKKEWILAFAAGLIRREVKISWQLPVGTRSETVDREVARALVQSGCFTMSFAPESGSPKTLRRIKKMVNLTRLKQSIRECHEEGLNIRANIMLGFPGEKHRNVWETMRLLLEMSWIGVNDASVYPFSPYPGSPLFEELKKKGEIPELFSDKWFLSISYVEFSTLKCYSEYYGRWMLRTYQFLGHVIFYVTNFLFRPIRIWRVIRNLTSGYHESRSETILALFLRRLLLKTG